MARGAAAMTPDAIATLSRRGLMGAGLAAGLLPVASLAQQVRGRELVATAFGGPSQELIQRMVYDEVTRTTGARATQTPLLSAQAFARMRAEANSPQIGLFMFSGGQERPRRPRDSRSRFPPAPTSPACRHT
jgi:hypothetical protein